MISTFYVVLSLATLNLFFDKCYLQFIACSLFIANSQILHKCCKCLILNVCDNARQKTLFFQKSLTRARIGVYEKGTFLSSIVAKVFSATATRFG